MGCHHRVAPMFATDDTIVAIATPAGRGGLGVVRLSGPTRARLRRRCSTAARTLHLARDVHARIRHDSDGRERDRSKSSQRSFPRHIRTPAMTSSRFSAHGSPVVLRAIVGDAMAAGARLAEPGEFTLRAFLNGKSDLMQAEAVADLIDAVNAAAGARRHSISLRERSRDASARSMRALRSDRAARSVARFSGRGLSLRRARTIERLAIDGHRRAIGELLADASARPADS